MSSDDNSVLIVGSTGLVGKEILIQLNNSETIKNVYSLTRRKVPDFIPNVKTTEVIEPNIINWVNSMEKLCNENLKIFISSLGTTKAAAGSLERQYEIDHDLNLQLAKIAKKNLNIQTYILVSTMAASSKSKFPYLKMKGQLEEEIIDLKFNKTIILRPGVLLGKREKSKGLPASIASSLGSLVHNTFLAPYTLAPVSDKEIGRAILKIIDESKNYPDGSVKIIDATDLNKLAK
ncbi:hypothetical protein PACTADRAFT_2959 [Pachysolen tannophilus NRRL Y-2460]|uniref:NAD(P)-binding domain-containing protein n=1 Tax=Pachysolen tannophilus NRRL Y-2460 TaxID=669874 RepID=A0A1E4TU53_PACTA|nr:hypothetical protein PACTADRAFT_2959 [Pachysolen tannophilus NRRL Y-2460]